MWTAGSMIYCSVEWGVPCGKNHRDISRCQLHFFKTQIWFIGVPHFYFYDQDFIDWNMKSLKPLSCNFVSPAKPSVSEKQRNAVLFHWITPEVSFPAVRLCSCESHMLSFFFSFFFSWISKGLSGQALWPEAIVATCISKCAERKTPPCLALTAGLLLRLFFHLCLCRISCINGRRETNTKGLN